MQMRRRSVTDRLKLFGVLAVALILCGILANFVGSWLMVAWFVGTVLAASIYVYGNSPPTYLMVGIALAWSYILLFTDLATPR